MFSDIIWQEIVGAIALVISFSGSLVYILSILRQQTKPHLYTWIVWSILPTIAFSAQLYDHAGPGAWVTGMTSLSCILTTLLALKYGEKNITLGDKYSLIASLTAFLPWMITNDPLGSVIMVCIIDMVAFYPTFRKSWGKPHEESLLSYNIHTLKMALSLVAMTNFTATNTLYPLVFVIGNIAFTFFCLWRRKVLAGT